MYRIAPARYNLKYYIVIKLARSVKMKSLSRARAYYYGYYGKNSAGLLKFKLCTLHPYLFSNGKSIAAWIRSVSDNVDLHCCSSCNLNLFETTGAE